MHKIYSRPRLKIPKLVVYNRHTKKYNSKKLKLVIIILIAVFTFGFVLNAVLPVFDTLCKNEALSVATLISNNKATEVMENHTYDELFSIEKDNDGNITMIKSNVIPINEIISDVAVKIQEEINSKGRDDIEIALRQFYWIKIVVRKRTGSEN